MKVYKPVAGKGFAWGVGFLIFTVAVTALPIIFSSMAGAPKLSFLLIMGFISLMCAGMFGYFLWAISNLHYALEDNHLLIKWAFQTKRIPVQNIRSVAKVMGNSSMKVVGASWPGFHMGSFSNPRGKGTVNLYATQIWGDIVLIKTKWETIGITPQDADQFLDDLNKLVPNLAEEHSDTVVEEVSYSPWKDKLYLGCLGGSLLMLAGAFLYLQNKIPSLPNQVPMHWNFSGQVDRYGAPQEIYLPFGIGVAVTVLLNGINLMVAKNNATSVRLMGLTGLFISILFSIIAIAMVMMA